MSRSEPSHPTGVAAQAPVFTNARLPDGQAGVRYDFNFTASGVPNPVFALSNSTLFAELQPNGLLTTGPPGASGNPYPGLYSGIAIASLYSSDSTRESNDHIRSVTGSIAWRRLVS